MSYMLRGYLTQILLEDGGRVRKATEPQRRVRMLDDVAAKFEAEGVVLYARDRLNRDEPFDRRASRRRASLRASLSVLAGARVGKVRITGARAPGGRAGKCECLPLGWPVVSPVM